MPHRKEKIREAPVLDFERPVVELQRRLEELKQRTRLSGEIRREIESLETRARELQQQIFSDLTPWQKVLLARHPARPYTLDYVSRLFTDFTELHGDRRFADDPAMISRFLATASACPRSSASMPGNAPGVSSRQMMGLPNRAARSIRRMALR